jgi:competence protein ComEC
MRSARSFGLAGVAVALAGGIALADRAGPLRTTPALWVAAALAFALILRRRRGARALLCGLLAGGALSAHERSGLEAARAHLGLWADDRQEETLAGTVGAPVEDDGRALRFALDLAPDAAGLSPRVLVAVFRDPDDEPWTPPLLPGDAIEVTGALRLPRGYRVPGAPPAERFADSRGAAALLNTDWSRVSEPAGGSALDPWRAAALLQRRTARAITAAAGDADRDGVLRALVTGDTSAMSERAAGEYRDSGASHVLAVSGLHLAAVALFAFAALRRIWAAIPALALRADPARAAALGAAPLAIGYTMVTGAPPSAVRALWMVLLLLAGAALDRRARVRDALGAAALAMLVVRPASLYDPSLELSIAATAALALFMGARRRDAPAGVIARAWRGLRDLVVASAWTWAATAPICAFHFGAVAMAGPVANLIAVPAVELAALPLGLAGAALSELWPAGGAAILAVAAALTARVTAALGHVASWIPPLAMPAPGVLDMVAWSGLLLAAAAWLRLRGALVPQVIRRRRALVAVGAAAALALAGSQLWRGELAPRRRDELRAAFVDVGQGDAAVIELPGGGVWLIDGGGLPYSLPVRDRDTARRLGEAPGREGVARYLAERRIRRIDLAILSHAHPDHYRGLGAIARAAHIEELWMARRPAGAPVDGELARLLAELAAGGTRVRSPPAGAVLRAGGATLSLLAPGPSPDDGDPSAAADPVRTENDNSLVARLDFAGRRLLFTGDIEEEGEDDLLRERGAAALAADLVKVPHHGSRTSSTAALVAATSPRWAVISCGPMNRFGFPHPEVVARWRAAGAAVLSTDRAGTITAVVGPDGAMSVESVESVDWGESDESAEAR